MRTRATISYIRLLFVISAGLLLAGGATFAALQTQNAVLQGNRLVSATANLLIGDAQGGFGASAPGFKFENVESGGSPMPTPGHRLILKNEGSTTLSLQLKADPSNLRNPQSANFNQVFIVVTPLGGTTAGIPVSVSLQSLLNAYAENKTVPLKIQIPAGQTMQYHLQMQLGATATGSISSGTTIEGIDLLFSGTTATE